MADAGYIVQRVEWYQFRAADGAAFFVMVSSLPNGFFTAVPCEIGVTHGDHSLIGLAATPEDALQQLQSSLAGKSREQIFPPK